jgi:type VI secretion system secreted protein Hcp
MAFDAFLKIDGINGESTDDKHKDWVGVESFNWGVVQQAASSAGAGGMAGKAVFSDFNVVKPLDKASPSLFQACATGQHIKELTVSLCRATGDKTEYLQYKFSDVIVSNYQSNGIPSGGTALPTEQVSFNFATIKITYTPIDPRTGKAAGPVAVGYDLKKASKV